MRLATHYDAGEALMSSAISKFRRFRLTPLAACLALALAASETPAQPPMSHSLFAATATRTGRMNAASRTKTSSRDAAAGQLAPAPIEVTSCADDGTAGTLRYEVSHAPDGGTVDMSNLICSTITLANGAIVIGQNGQNTLFVTASPSNRITIDAHGMSRVIAGDSASASTLHQLYLSNLELANGYIRNDSSSHATYGGCVYWPGGGLVIMQSTTVTGCKAMNAAGVAEGGAVEATHAWLYGSTISDNAVMGLKVLGGGVFAGDVYLRDSVASGNQALSPVNATGAYAHGGGIGSLWDVRLLRSSVTNNLAQAQYGSASGAGVYNKSAFEYRSSDIAYSTISGNRAVSIGSSGGGVTSVGGTINFSNSTIDHNQSVNNSALVVSGISGDSVSIRNSTISTNTATTGSSAIFASIPLTIDNSTIAFNIAAGTAAGIYLYPGGNLDVSSTIIANNTSTAGGGFDLVSRATVTGANNLIQKPNSMLPASVAIVGVDPVLAPLANNGGLTSTHALQVGSPAIDTGSNPKSLPFDQRGTGFARLVGAAVDIGAYESNPDRIFANGFE